MTTPKPPTAPPDARQPGAEGEDEEERPTLIPDFDPAAFARDSEVKLFATLPETGEPSMDKARRLAEQGEHEKALFVLARLLDAAPLHSQANALANQCRTALERECLSAIGSVSTVFVVAVTPDKLKGMELDHVSGFLLSRLDGATDVETLLDLAGLPRLLALRHLRDLLARGVIEVAKIPRP